MHMVEEAQARKAPSQQLVEVFSRYYIPVVLISALGIMLIPWLFSAQPFGPWFYKGLVLLVTLNGTRLMAKLRPDRP